jgi:predicted heme/steroid binding protein
MSVPYKLNYFEVESGLDVSSTFLHKGDFTANRIIKIGGTSNDILLGDGSIGSLSGKQNTISLTTIGTSGAATLIGSTLNIPNYSPDLSGYVPTSRQLTINGATYDLTTNRIWSVGTVTSVSALTLGTSGTDLSSSVDNSTTSPIITLNVPTASATNRGVLSSTDWSEFKAKQDAGDYITSLIGEATASGAGAASVTLNNAAVIGKVLTGLNVEGGTVTATDSILTAFGKVQSQLNDKQGAITLTTAGTSGAATFDPVTGELNIPEYQGGVTSFNTRTGAITLTSGDVTTALGYIPVTQARTITINGVTQDLSADQDWTINAGGTGVRTQYTFIATAGQTTFTTVGYTVGQIDVYYNGSKQLPSEYVATNGTTVVFPTGKIAGDEIEIVVWSISDITSGDSFEYFSKNLKSYPYSLNYTGTVLNSIVYTLPSGTITKTFSYTGTTLSSIALSGAVPTTILTTKTFTYTGTQLTSVVYS